MSLVVAILRDVRERLTDPRRWIKGMWSGHRDRHGVLWSTAINPKPPTCWCLGGAINVALNMNLREEPIGTFTELRSEVERELLETLGQPLSAIYIWNDAPTTAHADVVSLLDRTIQRLAPVAA